MSKEALQAIVGKAVVDREFEHTLLARPPEAISEFDLTEEEIAVITAIRANSLAQFAHQLHRWISQNGHNGNGRNGTHSRWPYRRSYMGAL